MKWNELIALRISEQIINQLTADNRIKQNQPEETIRKQIEQKIQINFHQEKELVEEVYEMMENLEKQGHSFERQKMFPILKAQLAKQKGFVL